MSGAKENFPSMSPDDFDDKLNPTEKELQAWIRGQLPKDKWKENPEICGLSQFSKDDQYKPFDMANRQRFRNSEKVRLYNPFATELGRVILQIEDQCDDLEDQVYQALAAALDNREKIRDLQIGQDFSMSAIEANAMAVQNNEERVVDVEGDVSQLKDNVSAVQGQTAATKKSVKTNRRRIRWVAYAVACAIVLSVVAVGLSGKAVEQTAPEVEAQSPEPTKLDDKVETQVEVPFWFKNEVHFMVTGRARHVPAWWGRQMKKASPEELVLFDDYLASQKRDGANVYWIADAESRIADVRKAIQETASAALSSSGDVEPTSD